jgi:hypothetical protein
MYFFCKLIGTFLACQYNKYDANTLRTGGREAAESATQEANGNE